MKTSCCFVLLVGIKEHKICVFLYYLRLFYFYSLEFFKSIRRHRIVFGMYIGSFLWVRWHQKYFRQRSKWPEQILLLVREGAKKKTEPFPNLGPKRWNALGDFFQQLRKLSLLQKLALVWFSWIYSQVFRLTVCSLKMALTWDRFDEALECLKVTLQLASTVRLPFNAS